MSMAQCGADIADVECVTEARPSALTGVGERIDALEGHLAQLLARQRDATAVPPTTDNATNKTTSNTTSDKASAPIAWTGGPEVAPVVDTRGDVNGRIVRSDLQFDSDDDPDGFDERFSAFTDATEVDERSRDWLLS